MRPEGLNPRPATQVEFDTPGLESLTLRIAPSAVRYLGRIDVESGHSADQTAHTAERRDDGERRQGREVLAHFE